MNGVERADLAALPAIYLGELRRGGAMPRDDDQRPDEALEIQLQWKAGTHPKLVRRLIAQMVLTDNIVNDPRWHLFETWGADTGLVAVALEWRQLRDQGVPDTVAKEAGGRVGHLIGKKQQQIVDLATAFVAGTKWSMVPGLLNRLAARFVMYIGDTATAPFPFTYRYQIETTTVAPTINVPEFKSLPGEGADAALTRLDAHIRQAQEARQAITARAEAKQDGRMPTADGDKVRRNVDWLYQVDTGLATVAELARKYHGERDVVTEDDRKVIRAGIETARRDLGIAPSSLREN
jgi:hypothetical protein